VIRGRPDFWTANGGATAVEFALVIGPLLLLLFGTIEFSRLLWTREALQSIASAGARCMGVVEPSCANSGAYSSSKAISYVVSEASKLSVPLATSNVTVNHSATCAGVTNFSQVTVSYTFQTALPELVSALSGGVALSATACFPNQS
jgi:Flp pilus assembly protein TadG